MASIGDTQAFPKEPGSHPGMTYRQWLIGKALEGWVASCATRRAGPEDLPDPMTRRSPVVRRIVEAADAVIAELDAEGKKDAAQT